MHDTGRSFGPILMKFKWLVRVHPCMYSMVIGNKRPNGTIDIRENVPPKPVFWLSFSPMFFVFCFWGINFKTVFGTPFPTKKAYSFLSSDAPFPQKWSCTQKLFAAVILENIVFLEKIIQRKIFKTSILQNLFKLFLSYLNIFPPNFPFYEKLLKFKKNNLFQNYLNIFPKNF